MINRNKDLDAVLGKLTPEERSTEMKRQVEGDGSISKLRRNRRKRNKGSDEAMQPEQETGAQTRPR
jgi:hypothetical protein